MLNLEVAMSMTKKNTKIYKSRLFDEVLYDSIYNPHWKKAIKKDLQNLENHQT